MAILRIPRGSSPVLNVKMWEGVANASPPLNLTAVPVAIVDSNLPVAPVIAVVDAPNGVCSLTFPDTSAMPLNKPFKLRIRIGVAGAPGTFTTPYLEVMVA